MIEYYTNILLWWVIIENIIIGFCLTLLSTRRNKWWVIKFPTIDLRRVQTHLKKQVVLIVEYLFISSVFIQAKQKKCIINKVPCQSHESIISVTPKN